VNVQTALVIAVGFLAGMIPAMLLVFYLGNRRLEKQRKDLKLKYDRQIMILRSTLERTMQRIDLLSNERAQLKRSKRILRESLREQHQYTDETSAELIQLRTELDKASAENLRHEGRLEQAYVQQERLEAQFAQTVAQFTEAERLRKHLLFATRQLQMTQATSQTPGEKTKDEDPISSANLDVAVIESIEPVYVERLHDSGIYTISDLAQQTPDQVANLAGLPSWEESAQWIAEANALLAAPPDNGF
jgi:predicted flap endonuclease-1-like 5' DNA nuclease